MPSSAPSPASTTPVDAASSAPQVASGPGRSLHILFVSHYFPPEGNAPASRVHEMCRQWVAAGHRVTVITSHPNHPGGKIYEGYRNRWKSRETIDGIEVIRIWTFLAANKGTIKRILNYTSFMGHAVLAGLFGNRPDVLIATSPQFFCGIAGMLLRYLRRLPFVLEIRDIWPESIATVGAMKSSLLLRPLAWLEKRMYRSAQHIVTVGSGYKQLLEAKGIAATDISVVTNGIDQAIFSPRPPSQEIRERYALQGKYVVGVVGTLGMASGLHVVLRAARKLREAGNDDVRFLLVGDGAIRAELEAEAAEAELDNVIFTGRRPKAEMPDFLATLDVCLVHLIKQELFRFVLPSKIFEANAMERPIVLGVQGCAAELVNEARAGLTIEPEDEDQLLAAIDRLRQDPEYARQLGRNGRAHVLEHYDRTQLAMDYLQILEQQAAPVSKS
jgi:glycosyltransferase involved in cell wall biosynthesis